MSRNEERIHKRPITAPGLAELTSQLARLREDLARFSAKHTTVALQAALRVKIAQLEAEITALEHRSPALPQTPAGVADPAPSQTLTHHARTGRFPPRFRGGR